MAGIRQLVQARTVQDTELFVVVLELEVVVLPEGLHVSVVVEPVGDHAPLEPSKLVDGGDEQEEENEGVRVANAVRSI